MFIHSTKIFLTSLTLLVVFMSSCVHEDVDQGNVNFSAGFSNSDSKLTGNNGDEWEPGDEIGVFMVNHGTATISGSNSNMLYITNAGGYTNADFTGSILMGTGTYDFVAYYPYVSGTSFGVKTIDLSDLSDLKPLDFMYCFDNNLFNLFNGYDLTDVAANNVYVRFHHKLSRLVFSLVPGEGITGAELADAIVTVEDIKYKGNIDFTDRSSAIVSPSSQTKDVLFYKSTSISNGTGVAQTLEGYVIPQDFSGIKVSIKLKDTSETFTYQFPSSTSFVEGGQFNYKLTVNRKSRSHNVKATCTKLPW